MNKMEDKLDAYTTVSDKIYQTVPFCDIIMPSEIIVIVLARSCLHFVQKNIVKMQCKEGNSWI